jgi:hypothetical protein
MDLGGQPQGGGGEFATTRMRIPTTCRPPNAHDATEVRRAGSKPTTRRLSLATWWPRAKCRKVDRPESHKADLDELLKLSAFRGAQPWFERFVDSGRPVGR